MARTKKPRDPQAQPERWTEARVLDAIAAQYPSPAWAFLPQVANRTGYGQMRYADAIAMSLYPSRGIFFVGFEVKVEARDWKKELSQPRKAEEIAQWCSQWWVVCPDEKVVKPETVPPGWGLAYVGTGTWTANRPAPFREVGETPRRFLAAVMRRYCEQAEAFRLAAYQKGMQAGIESAPEREDWDHQRAMAEVERRANRAEAAIRAFEETSGIAFNTYDAGLIGAAVKQVLAIKRHYVGVEGEIKGMKAACEQIIAYAAAWESIGRKMSGDEARPSTPVTPEHAQDASGEHDQHAKVD